MANIPQVLLDILQSLGGKELKLFQWKLTSGVEGFRSIPKALLENADRLDTVDHMIGSYEFSGAVEITLSILEKINQNQLAEELRLNLRESGNIFKTFTCKNPVCSPSRSQTEDTFSCLPADREQCDITRKLKTKFKVKLAKLYEGTSSEGHYMALQDIYTELYVTEGCTGGVNVQHEVRQVEDFFPKSEEIPVKFSDIFKVQHDQNILGTKVLTLGIAGVGKTASIHKFILDWAEGYSNQDLDFILFLPFRELNLIKEQEYSLWELLLYFHDELSDEDATEILSQSCKVVFILDGLDESRITLNFNQMKISNIKERTTLEKLITALVKGDLLPSAFIWITSRPAVAYQIPLQYFDHVTEVRGFNNQQKEEYFRKRVRYQDQASMMISHIKQSRSLHILCHIPVFCRISASVLEEMLKDGKDISNAPTTLTEMYTRFLLYQMRQKCEKYSRNENKSSTFDTFKRDKLGALDILKLGKLAFLQLQKGKILFYEKDLKECDIDAEEALVYSGVCTQIFKKDETVFSFVHLTFQEFLAAIFVFLTFTQEFNPLIQTMLEKIKWNLQHRLCDLLKTAVDKAMKSKNGHLDLFLRFLFGLSLESNQRLIKSLQPEMSIREENLKDIVDYIKIKIRKTKSYEKKLNLFHCLSELKDNSLTSEIQNYMNLGDLSTQKLTSTQWSALLFILLMSEETQEKFELKKYRPSDEGLRRLLPLVKNTRRALLDSCNLSKDSSEALASVFSSDSALRELDLSKNDLQDSGVEKLFAGLRSSHCKLDKLRLAGCNLTVKSCEMMCSAVKAAIFTLSELDLSDNDLNDIGVEKLSAVLKICKLEKLKLENCNLSKQCCEALASVMSSNSTLKELDLSNNNLEDSGAKKLCAGLNNSHCTLEILRLSKCNLSKHSCGSLASVLQGTSSMKEIDLSKNCLQDLGINMLFSGLSISSCKMEKLRLSGCNLSLNACETFCFALKSANSCLIELHLCSNVLQDAGVKLLSDGLKNSHCNLETLRLSGCMITEEGCASLASALSSNLKELDVSYNHVGDTGVNLLCDRLEGSQFRLENLKLAFCTLTVECCRTLASALQSAKSTLKYLDLSNNDLHDSGVKRLSAGLKSSSCKLETLRLSGCMITEEGCASLALALSSNPSHLKELDLTYNHPGDTGLKLLSVKLEDPQCRLEKLRVEHAGKAWIKPGLRKYACELTLDPNTVNRNLSLSEETRKVTWVKEEQPYPDHPERFDSWEQVLCRESLTGRCYWETEWDGWAYIAVTYKGISRKGDEDDCKLGCTDMSWRLFCSHIGYSVYYNKKGPDLPPPPSRSNRVGVYVDHEAGTLSFYSISTDTNTLTHLHTLHTTFTEPLYAGFRACIDSFVQICQLK
ncbi:NACHT, LRR and PYD domains-containing protein 12-like [Hoplias malabaricus]|uniref:NACHT, LRR and PYD domains-containing protein 12-like n=1 Tax=Hoplias malabaricus TaxID=27720 RepID=UPI003462747D